MRYDGGMWRFAAVFWFAAGCAGGASELATQPLFAAGWSGPPPHGAVQLDGPGASADARARCTQALGQAGAVVDAQAPVRARVTLDPRGNRLQVSSARRGLVRDEPRPAWSIERLCDDALLALASALRQEQPSAAPAPDAPDGEPPSWTTTTAAIPNDSPGAPGALPSQSGGAYHGPIE